VKSNLNIKLTLEMATDIKTRIWFCQKQTEIAAIYDVSQTTISRIVHGEQWKDAPWPSGQIGALPADRINEIRTSLIITGGDSIGVDIERVISQYRDKVEEREAEIESIRDDIEEEDDDDLANAVIVKQE